MVEKALILPGSWNEDGEASADVLVRIEVPDRVVTLYRMDEPSQSVTVTFEELEAITKLVEEARGGWGDPKPNKEPDSHTAAH